MPHSEVGVAMVVEVVMGVEEVEVTGADAELKIVMLVKIITAMETSYFVFIVWVYFWRTKRVQARRRPCVYANTSSTVLL